MRGSWTHVRRSWRDLKLLPSEPIDPELGGSQDPDATIHFVCLVQLANTLQPHLDGAARHTEHASLISIPNSLHYYSHAPLVIVFYNFSLDPYDWPVS